MDAYNCTTELNFAGVAGGTFYTANELPAKGMAKLSNIAGTVSAPPSGTVFSYTNFYDSTVYTITAAVEGKAPAVASGTPGAARVAGTASGSGSAAGATSTSEPKTGDAAVDLRTDGKLAVVIAFVAGAFPML